MDPNRNIAAQRTIAQRLVKRERVDVENLRAEDFERVAGDLADAERLAELVLALDEWRKGGGFDPYRTTPANLEDVMHRMRALAQYAVAEGWTDTGDVVEDVAAWEVTPAPEHEPQATFTATIVVDVGEDETPSEALRSYLASIDVTSAFVLTEET